MNFFPGPFTLLSTWKLKGWDECEISADSCWLGCLQTNAKVNSEMAITLRASGERFLFFWICCSLGTRPYLSFGCAGGDMCSLHGHKTLLCRPYADNTGNVNKSLAATIVLWLLSCRLVNINSTGLHRDNTSKIAWMIKYGVLSVFAYKKNSSPMFIVWYVCVSIKYM